MKYLIDYGLDVNVLDKNRRNILFKVILKGSKHLDTLDALLDRRVDLNIKDMSGKTLLDEILKIISIAEENDLEKYRLTDYRYVETENNYLKMTSILIEHGLMIDRKDSNGKTALFYEIDKKIWKI